VSFHWIFEWSRGKAGSILQGIEKTRSAPNVGQQNWVFYKLAQSLIHFGGSNQFCNSAGLRSGVFLFLFLFFLYIYNNFFLSFFFQISNVASYASIARGI
jgi:hypothetical protein